MDKEQLKIKIRSYLGEVKIPDIPCCEDSITNYDAYNNIDNMYRHNNVDTLNIRFFLLFRKSKEMMALIASL